jgi:hypothetical protein
MAHALDICKFCKLRNKSNQDPKVISPVLSVTRSQPIRIDIDTKVSDALNDFTVMASRTAIRDSKFQKVWIQAVYLAYNNCFKSS